MKKGTIVKDTRCKTPEFRDSIGIVLAVVGDTCWVQWASSPDYPLWAPIGAMEIIQ